MHRLRNRRVLMAVAVCGVLFFAAGLRLWALGRPSTLVFDELYYVRDAVSQLTHGFTTTWPDNSTVFDSEAATQFSDQPNAIAHPPLGKWIIGLGILLFGPDSAWGWRLAGALAGVATVGAVMRLGWLMTRSSWVAVLAGLILAIDGVHVVLSRIAILDGLLTTLVTLGALCLWLDQERNGSSLRGRHIAQRGDVAAHAFVRPITWNRPWLLAAAVSFGAAAAIKWSGLYPLAAFLVLITLRDWWLRKRAGNLRPLGGTAVQALVTALIALPTAFATYVSTWIGWILSPNAQNRVAGEAWWVSLARWHADALSWHTTLSAPHPFAAHPAGWPLGLRPTSMYSLRWTEGCPWNSGCITAISPLPNPLITWAGVAALLLLTWLIMRAGWIAARSRPPLGRVSPLSAPGTWAALFIVTGFLSGWLPWLLTVSRSAVFQFYAVVLTPFSALALALVLASIAGLLSRNRDVLNLAGFTVRTDAPAVRGRRIAVLIFVGAAILAAIFFASVWLGVPTAEWYWRAHMWLPGWR